MRWMERQSQSPDCFEEQQLALSQPAVDQQPAVGQVGRAGAEHVMGEHELYEINSSTALGGRSKQAT